MNENNTALTQLPAVNFAPAAAEILSFLRLPEGWHYGRGVPASVDAVFSSLEFFRMMKDLAFGRFEAFPEASGGVLLSSFHGENIVEILFRADGKFDVTVEQEDSFAEIVSAESVDKATALGIIWKIAHSNPSRLFGSSIPGTIVERSVDSKVLPLEIMTTVFRSWSHSVLQRQVVVFANTSLNSTQISQVNHQFTGVSLRQNFHEPSRSFEPHQQQGTSATLSPWVVKTANISTGSNASR
jgi:hypothetical protein